MKPRDYYKKIWIDFNAEKPLILVSGPRQAGKTTFVEDIASDEPVSLVFNYDIPENKVRIIETPTFFQEVDRIKGTTPLIVLDEIHKYSEWKNYLKGIYDGFSKEFRFLVTGSGRLDLSQKRGDSLAGRFLHFHLYPFTIGEIFSSAIGLTNSGILVEIPGRNQEAQDAWETMFHVSGFPEPFIKGTKIKYRRWAKSYHSQVIRNDIRDEFAVRQIDKMETLYHLLSTCVGSPFSASKNAALLKVSHKTVSAWISVFERFFLIFKIRPYSERIKRSLAKEPKLYFYDYCRIADEAFRFENMVAVELRRALTLWNDFGLGEFELWYLRNKEKEEVDFLVTDHGIPLFMVEAKLSRTELSASLLKFQITFNVPAIQLVNKPSIARKIKNGSNEILVVSAATWLAGLN
ncbi:MAG: ATP-binding protein [Deltaproteobacteria bacterium]|nr:ATP-binding protein [Deltaproteobacteria bacterium]